MVRFKFHYVPRNKKTGFYNGTFEGGTTDETRKPTPLGVGCAVLFKIDKLLKPTA